MKIFVWHVSLCLLTLSTQVLAKDCNQTELVKKLKQFETKQLLQNAPTFKHGLDSGTISLSFDNISSKDEHCSSLLSLTLPQQDIDDVNTHLDQYPAKRILLGAQGYSIPEHTTSTSNFDFELNTDGEIKPLNTNLGLKDLHQSIQYMYELLAQLRAEFNPNDINKTPWPKELTSKVVDACKTKLTTTDADLNQACQCQVEKTSLKISPYQMLLIDYVNNQPYSVATGTLNSYVEFSKAVNRDCGLHNR